MSRSGALVCQSPNTPSFRYADGAESLLHRLFTQQELQEEHLWKVYQWWPLSYHLSPVRANLLRWIPWHRPNLRVLEVGAGCGAITSYLCRVPAVQHIVAIEGAPQRAELIRLRCRYADHLEVVTTNAVDYRPEEPFDLVLLIGVLEYAGRYIPKPDAASYLLRWLRRCLKPDGYILVAIENPIGHKYLAGYREDHYGVPFESVSGYPDYQGIRTFDRKLLQTKLEEAGFPQQLWFYPFPDYKLPEVILAERSFCTEGFDWLTLMNLPTTDYSLPQKPLFNEREFLHMIARNADPSAFMNSFLVIASEAPLPSEWQSILAVKMRSLCDPVFRQTRYFIQKDGEITVQTVRGDCQNPSAPVEQQADYAERYYPHLKNIENLFIDCLWHRQYAEAAAALLRWYTTLLAHAESNAYAPYDEPFEAFCRERMGRPLYTPNSQWLPPNYLDLTPRNCLLNVQSGEVTIIDQEWNLGIPLPLDLVTDRSMFYLMQKVSHLFGTDLVNRRGEWNLPRALLNRLPPPLCKGRLGDILLFEQWFQKAIVQGSFDYRLSENDLRAAQTSLGVTRKRWFSRFLRRLGDASRSSGRIGGLLRWIRATMRV